MPMYNVYEYHTMAYIYEVEAASEEEAIDIYSEEGRPVGEEAMVCEDVIAYPFHKEDE